MMMKMMLGNKLQEFVDTVADRIKEIQKTYFRSPEEYNCKP